MKVKQSFILCATDFSPPANDAATVAAKLALRRGEKLHLIHATDSPSASVLAILKNRLDAEMERLQKTSPAQRKPIHGYGMPRSDEPGHASRRKGAS